MGTQRTQRMRFGLELLGLGVAVVLVAGCAGTMAQMGNSFHAQRAYETGLTRYQAKDYRGAIPHFERAVTLHPAFADAEAYLAWSYYKVGEYPQATRHFRQALVRQPQWAGLYDGLGWSRYQAGRYQLALDAFKQALALDSRYRDAEVGLAYTLFALERYTEARLNLERLVREGEGGAFQGPLSDVEEIRARYAWTLFYLRDYAGARAQFTKGLAAHPDWAGLHNGLGWTFLRLGDRVRAAASFQRALELRSDFQDAKEGLAQVKP